MLGPLLSKDLKLILPSPFTVPCCYSYLLFRGISGRIPQRNCVYIYNKVDDEKPLIQNLKFHVINRQLTKFTKYDVTQFKTRHCNGILLRGFYVNLQYHSWQVCTYFSVYFISVLLVKRFSLLYVAILYFSFKHKRQRLLFGL